MSIFSFLYESVDERICRYENEMQKIVGRMVYLLNHHALPYHIMKNGIFEPGYRWASPMSEAEYDDLKRRLVGTQQSLHDVVKTQLEYEEGIRGESLISD